MTALTYVVEILGIVVGILVIVAMVIVAVEYDKASKWNDIYKKRGRDDE